MIIVWDKAENDEDYTADAGIYTLRVEELDEGLWWWCVYREGQDNWVNDECHAQTKEEAMNNCIEILKEVGVVNEPRR